MILENDLLDIYFFYIEENCLKEGCTPEQAFNRSNRNGYIPKKLVKDKCSHFLLRTEFTKLLRKINTRIIEEMVLKNFAFNMPCKLGEISIKKKKPTLYVNDDGEVVNKLPINWGETKKLWENDAKSKKDKKFVRYLNTHTNGYSLFFHYYKGIARYNNKSLYVFKASDTAKKILYNAVKNNKDLDFYLKK
jgi:hypothetical protein